MAIESIDPYFLNLPPFDRAPDFGKFWNNAISEIKKTPLEPVVNPDNKHSTHRFTHYIVTFRGFTKSRMHATLLIPRHVPRPQVVMIIHDYNTKPRTSQGHLNENLAYLFVTLRGHDNLPEQVEGEKKKTPGYMIENILDRETYYVKAVYLDAYRAVDLLRLLSQLDCSRMGVMGKGFGAAVAVFVTANCPRVQAMVLETPSFCHLAENQNLSTSDQATEINDFITERKNRKKQVKENLSYFDALNFSDSITCPVLVTMGLKDTIAPPLCSFGLFHHLLCDKTAEIYPDDGNEAGGDVQFRKSLAWIAEKIR